jgi:hypothetical protein
MGWVAKGLWILVSLMNVVGRRNWKCKKQIEAYLTYWTAAVIGAGYESLFDAVWETVPSPTPIQWVRKEAFVTGNLPREHPLDHILWKSVVGIMETV